MIRLRKVSQTQQGIKQQAHYLGNTPMTRQGPETGPKQKQRQTCTWYLPPWGPQNEGRS